MNHYIATIKQTQVDMFKVKNNSLKIELSSIIKRNTLVTEVLNGSKTFRVQIKKCNMR